MRVICKIKQMTPANGRPMVKKVSLRQEEGDQQAHRNPSVFIEPEGVLRSEW
jgi:hypothetical protein